ncbi:MAG TPA: hypothetical protein VM600_05200 [Actinomycetota bacterium]|nr:hypothetical protein [Actinomycetota bacterium]
MRQIFGRRSEDLGGVDARRVRDALHAAYGAGPGGELRDRHLAAIVEESRAVAGSPVPSRVRTGPVLRRRLVSIGIRVAAAAFTVSAATTGLALTGAVTLPEPARDALSKIGIQVSDGEAPGTSRGGTATQTDGGSPSAKSSAAGVRAVIEATPTSERGCAFGRAVSSAANGKTRDKDSCDKDDAATADARATGAAAGERQAEVGDEPRSRSGDGASNANPRSTAKSNNGKAQDKRPDPETRGRSGRTR